MTDARLPPLEIRVMLNEDDFRRLVSGGIVDVPESNIAGRDVAVKIALSDIGWNRMVAGMRDAIEGQAERAQTAREADGIFEGTDAASESGEGGDDGAQATD